MLLRTAVLGFCGFLVLLGLASLALLTLFWSGFNEPPAVHPIYRDEESAAEAARAEGLSALDSRRGAAA